MHPSFYYLILSGIFLGVSVALAAAAYHFQIYRYVYNWYLGLRSPSCKVAKEHNLLIPMRDGIILSADLYRPKEEGRYPAVLLRTPYGKENTEHSYPVLATILCSLGYVVLVQDVRGKYASEGEFNPFIHEEKDGNDTIDWISSQQWSSGAVALYGFSYLGSCAWLAARDPHPCLKTIIPMFSGQNAYRGWVDHGVPYLKDILYWLSRHGGRKGRDVPHEEVDLMIWQLPVLQFDKRLKDGIDTFKTWMHHLHVDDYWRSISVSHIREEIRMPVFFVAGWFDRFLTNTIEDFLETSSANAYQRHKKSRLLIGPWEHHPSEEFPEVSFGREAKFRSCIKFFVEWLDLHLKGEASTFDENNPIDYFMMGENRWRKASSWPPKEAKEKFYFLHGMGKANTMSGDGVLTAEQPADEKQDHYVYDPLDPCPSLGNNMIYGNQTEGPREQSLVGARRDVLAYKTEPLPAPVKAVGPVSLILFVSSSALDTDFCAKLVDIHPNGKSYFLVAGFIRMRFLDSVRATHGIEKGKIYRLEIQLGHTAHAFLKGHRIGLLVTSSDFPNHGRNLNTGGSNEGDSEEAKAFQTVYHGGIYASRLSLYTVE
ncbi:CocE/NonD family hydrolase [Estrella lausannensis]|uniref:Xaa-Pro dipeptidyl-peptidase n=1 Tax=Estrella lausannensis TaxID=483423 RepID=A0A0H5DSV0_9BACT|nr:CocE/NonD family hydrolase [Estrella lausannensis]CRX38889.1 Xaa-Pro dipeptidyl-peptidase [Estrella lausannensis]